MTSPIRILYLIGQLGLGGSERQLYLLLKHLDKTRFEPQVVVFNPSPNYTLEQDLRRAGVVVYELPQNYRPAWKRLAWVTRLACQLQPHILHSWTLHNNAYAALASLLCRVPVRLGSVRGALVTSGVSGNSLWMRLPN